MTPESKVGDSFQGLRRQTESMYKRIAHSTVISSEKVVGGHSRVRARPHFRTFSFSYNILFIGKTVFIFY